jgi:hypothetical protein
MRIRDDGTEASGRGYALHIDQGADKQLCPLLHRRQKINAAGCIVEEDGGISGAEVGIEVGDDAAQMHGMGFHGLLIAEVVGLKRCGDDTLRGRKADRLGQRCGGKREEEQSQGEGGLPMSERNHQAHNRAEHTPLDLPALTRVAISISL